MKLLTTTQRNSLIIATALICGVLFTQIIVDAGRRTIDKERNSIVKENIDLKSIAKRVNRNKNNALTTEGKTQAFDELNNLKNIDQLSAKEKIQNLNFMQTNIAILIAIIMLTIGFITLRYCRKE
jgi:hypothetical protein